MSTARWRPGTAGLTFAGVVLSFLSLGCGPKAKVWVVTAMPGKGVVIGYTAGDRPQDQALLRKKMHAEVRKACGETGGELVEDSMRSEKSIRSYQVPVYATTRGQAKVDHGRYFGTSTVTTEQRTRTMEQRHQEVTNYWREATVVCKSKPPAPEVPSLQEFR